MHLFSRIGSPHFILPIRPPPIPGLKLPVLWKRKQICSQRLRKANLRRDPCGDWNVSGRRGHISTDGTAFYFYLQPGTKRRWEKAKRDLGLIVTQDGDDEGILRMDELSPAPLAETLRRLLGLRKSVRPSDKQRATLARFQFGRDNNGVSGRSIAATEVAASLERRLWSKGRTFLLR
jgi:hypothetical protein